MIIRRGERPQSNFYILDKRISEDERLSWGARGILIYLLGKPDDWKLSVADLIKRTQGSAKPSGRAAVYGLINELKDAGYITQNQEKTRQGQFMASEYIVTESPRVDKPHTADPHTANRTLISIEYKQDTDSNNIPLPEREFSSKWYTREEGGVNLQEGFSVDLDTGEIIE